LQDFVEVAKGSSDEALFTRDDLEAAMEKVEVINFRQTLDLGNGIIVRLLSLFGI
jgi:Cft2 family RNA processing exonuclease